MIEDQGDASAGEAAASSRPKRSRSTRTTVIQVAFAFLGTLGLLALVRSVGADNFLSVLHTSAPWLPILFAMEGLHIVAEGALTYALSPRVRERVSLASLARVHILGFAVSLVVPAGRATGEATKAAMLSRTIGVAEAAAIGIANQSMSLLGSAIVAIPCLVASLWMTGKGVVSAGILGFALFTAGAFTFIQLACRLKHVGGFLGRRFARIREATVTFQDAARDIPLFPPGAVAATVANRAIGVGEYALILFAIGRRHGLGEALLAQGVSSIGGAIGDFIPGQIGATDGAFALAAPALGMTAADGIAAAVMLHVAQILWALVGWTLPLWWRADRAEPVASLSS